MSTYVVPQVLVFQEFNAAAAAAERALNAHIAGGHAYLLRHADAEEKPLGFLGYYDPNSDTCYPWPNRPAGASVDQDYTKVHMDDALLRYFSDAASSGHYIATVSGYGNRVRSATLAFKANGASYPRSSEFRDRDVAVGDVVKVVCSVGGQQYTLWTYVAGFAADIIDAVVGAATADAQNAATQSANPATYAQVGGADNCVEITSVDQSAYDGLEDGDINETYTVTVIASSVNGDATTARLRVTSASGRDDVAEVTPAAFGSPTAIGTRGLTVTWNNTGTSACSLSATHDSVSPVDFIAGQKWQVTCHQAYTAPTATSGGTYSGNEDVTYIVTVVKGGLWAAKPTIKVTTNKGTDISGPTEVTGPNVVVPVGTKGVTIKFNQNGLAGRDRFYISTLAAKESYYRTLILGHNFDKAVVDASPVEVGLELFIRKNIEVSKNRLESPPLVNWTQSDTEICLKSGVTAYDATWTSSGVPQPLPVFSESSRGYGKVYVTYRAWRSELCDTVNEVRDVGELDTAISGPLHPDNPLKWGVFKAVSNSNGTAVKFTSVCNPASLDAWLRMLEVLEGRDDVYGLVPLTREKAVLDAYVAHVRAQSSPEMGRWRVVWVNLSLDDSVARVSRATSTDGEEVLATVTDDPLTSGTQYTLLQVPARNSAFITNKVKAGDVVRLNYTTDGFGTETYEEYLVDAVISEDSLRLQSGPSAPVSVASKIEVWHTYSNAEKAEAVALAGGYHDRRIRAVWPDRVGSGGLVFPGYHLCAALAGLAAGIVPQQGMTNLEIAGFDDLSRTLAFSRGQLNTMAGGGVWVVTQDTQTGKVFTRHALTTGDYADVNQREESITRNVDSVSYYFLDLLKPFIGTSNVTDDLLANIANTIRSGILELSGKTFVRRLGPQILGGDIAELRQHAVLRDRVVVTVVPEWPYPLNNVELHLVV